MEQARLLGERYELSEVLGRGGMAEVRLGRDIRLGRTVAIKTLRSDLALDASFQARFRREAQSAASLNHPAIVSVYDTGEDWADGTPVPYIVMEYVDGQTLRELLNSGRKLLPERALEIAAGTLAALDYSHHNGIVHRDIKPGNVMLTRNGTVKVMDFGIARAVAETSSAMTATAAVIGTAQYLSPEQAKGEKVDARSDLYSTGCLLYELLTGQPPFTGDSPVSVAYQHVRENPKPPSQVDDQLTPPMDAIVLKALAKNPDNRYQTAGEMREDIERCISGRPVSAPPVMASPPPPPPAAPAPGTRPVVKTSGRGAPPPTAAIPAMVDEPLPPQRKRRGVGALILLLAVLLVAGAGALIGKSVLGGGGDGEKVAVPALQGLAKDDALSQLERFGLEPIVSSEHSETWREGLVISQDPVANSTVNKGDQISVVISLGEAKSTVPNVVGLQLADARERLKDNRLTVGTVKKQASPRPEGEVLASTPKAGTKRAPGSRVNLTVSTGVDLVAVPYVVGQSRVDAYLILTNAGFEVPEIAAQISDQVPPDHVLRQVPKAGLKLPAGSRVSIVVAQAPEQETPAPVEPLPTEEPAPTPTDLTVPLQPAQQGAQQPVAESSGTGTGTGVPPAAVTAVLLAPAYGWLRRLRRRAG